MGVTNLSEETLRLLYLYLAEFILAIILFFIFRHFGILYRRRFLYTWALSWFAFAIYIAATGVITIFFMRSQSTARLVISTFAQMSCFLQVVLILRGSYELVTEKGVNRRQFKGILLVLFLISLLSVVAFSQTVEDASMRYLLRVGSRTLVSGAGFLIAGIVVLQNKKFSRGFGQRILAISFILYSIYQLYYCLVVVLNVTGTKIEIPNFYGVVDLLVISMMGMSMIMWLLEDERARLEKANKELDLFLYSTSHDLRAPIASILGLTYLGKLEFEEERARTFMDMIEARVKKLDMVIGDILSLSRSKKMEVKLEEINLRDLLDNSITDIKFNKGASAISLDYQYSSSHIFQTDFSQMKIVLNNLLANAVKYHNLDQPNPFIRVAFFREKDTVRIAIEDNGQGIPEASLPKIFEMFYRASLNTEGTGLGLYIVKEALSKIKGTIEVKSEFGKGSTFTIVLENA
ncbi:sensor histidine kinase [Ohtaekwangia koreensis]|uniref:histidine kinase n=1 Tax=Ohtaekwangia koreensis TaxID=688867 RepID=A0A1T5LIJ2_9BACT|nr:HAMP domain-containing sensor histidine kinase [Ohtaekwangia koreensis]SKC75218.1 His Kinase A (phospho-acceptor) domain-containing protein [Ohtaekwangia koreensis]